MRRRAGGLDAVRLRDCRGRVGSLFRWRLRCDRGLREGLLLSMMSGRKSKGAPPGRRRTGVDRRPAGSQEDPRMSVRKSAAGKGPTGKKRFVGRQNERAQDRAHHAKSDSSKTVGSSARWRSYVARRSLRDSAPGRLQAAGNRCEGRTPERRCAGVVGLAARRRTGCRLAVARARWKFGRHRPFARRSGRRGAYRAGRT